MDISVVYGTKTGHSRKIANALAEALDTAAVDVKKFNASESTDILFIVGGIYGGRSNPDLIKFAQSLDAHTVKKVALITSCASRKFFQKEVRAALVSNHIDVATEEAVCWGSFLIYGWGHPNTSDYHAAIDFAKKQISAL